MKKKLKRMLTNNLGLKILSVVLALVTWLIMVNVSNPMMTVTHTIPVEFTNEDVLKNAGLTYESLSRNTVTVSYRIHVRDEARVSASDFSAYADLAQLYDVTGSIPVQTEITSYTARSLVQSGSVTVNPAVVRIQTEPIQTKTFELVAHTSGTEAEGYDIGEISLSPPRVTVTGAESAIGQISSAGVEIDVDEAETDITGSALIFFYDANGNRMQQAEGIELNVTQAAYNVSVLRVKDLTLNYKIVGTVADGFRFTGVQTDIQVISVVGLRSVLANLITLEIPDPALTLDGATGDVVVEVDLNAYLPDNVSMVGDQPTTATVTMLVEQLETRSYEYDADDIDLDGRRNGYEYTLDAASLTLQIRGLTEDLDTLDADDIRVRADVSDLEPGIHTLRLEAELEEGFDFLGSSGINVNIRDLTVPVDSESIGTIGPGGTAMPLIGGEDVESSTPADGDMADGEEPAGGETAGSDETAASPQ